MKLLDAAYEELKKAGKPLSAEEILAPILKAGTWTTNGKTPATTLGARIYTDIKDHGSSSRFVKVSRGLFGLSGVEASSDNTPSQGELFAEKNDIPVEAGTAGEVHEMASKFYEPAIAILKAARGKRLSATQVKNAIVIQFPDLKWCGGQGPIRAMLLSAAKRSTPIKQVEGLRPPMFYYNFPNGLGLYKAA